MEVVRLNEFDYDEIKAYFQIDRRIKRLEGSIIELQEKFYAKTMTTRIESDGFNIYTIGERLDYIIVDYLDTIRCKEKAIETLKRRKRYLNDFLNSLPPVDKHYLINRYTSKKMPEKFEKLDYLLYEEIQEINDAINFMNGYPPDIRSVEVSNDNLEDQFIPLN
mgnify:CR=1 FL=1